MASVVVLGTKAIAFDLGPHLDMTEDMMTAEGFSSDSIRYVQTGLCNLLSNKSSKAKGKDSDQDSFHAEWRSLGLSTKSALAKCAQKKDVESALLTLAESLLAVQQFYSQTNWASLQGVPADSTVMYPEIDTPGCIPIVTPFTVSPATVTFCMPIFSAPPRPPERATAM